MRAKSKIEKYLDKLCKKFNGKSIESEKSRYYSFNNRVLRISDHVGKNSTGSISIIFDTFDPGNYILYGHSSGKIYILDYKKLKEFVKNFVIISNLLNESTFGINLPPSISNQTELEITSNIIRTHFSKNQIVNMKNWLGKNNKLRKLL